MKLCDHKFENIYVATPKNKEFYGTEIVRWCSTCGSITVDREVKGKIYPEDIMGMKTPRGNR